MAETGDSSALTVNGSADVGYLENFSAAVINGSNNTVLTGIDSAVYAFGVFNNIGVGAGSGVIANAYNNVW